MFRRGLVLLSVVGLLSAVFGQVSYWDIRPLRPAFTTQEKAILSLGYQGIPTGVLLKVYFLGSSRTPWETPQTPDKPYATLRPKLSPNGLRRYTNDTIAVPTSKPGTYLVRAEMARQTRDVTFVVSNLGMVVKQAPDKVSVWVVNRTNSRPQRGATVTILRGEGDGSVVASGVTGPDGLWTGPAPGGAFVAYAQFGANIAQLQRYYYRDEENQESGNKGPVYVYTDRPVYRPGDTAYFKGIARQWTGGEYLEVANHSVGIEVKDENGTSILTQDATTGVTGTFDGSFTISDVAPPGSYRIIAKVDEGLVGSASYSILEYRKPEYKVTMKMLPPVVVTGETLVAKLDAKYYFGGPVPNSHVRWSAYVHADYGWYEFAPPKPTDEPDWETATSGEDEGSAPGYNWGEVHLEGQGVTDRNGVLLISLPTVFQKRFDRPMTVDVTAEMLDISGREGDIEASATVLPASRYVDIGLASWVGPVGQQAEATMTVVDPLTKTPESNVSFNIQLVHVKWARDGRNWHEVRTVKETRSLRSGPDGTVAYRFNPSIPGSYQITATSQDSRRRVATSSETYWVYGDIEGAYWGGTSGMSVIPSVHRARIGETVTVLLRAPDPNSAIYYAIEGSTIHRQAVVQTRNNVARLDIVVTPDLLPSFTVWAGCVSGGMLAQEKVSIGVSDPTKILKIDLKPVQNRYMPGDTAEYQVSAHDSAGNPVSAEFSLGVVDEAIYAIRSENTDDIRDFYYGPKENRVATEQSENLYYHVAMAAGRVQQKEAAMAAKREQRAKEGRVRRVFKDTAFWAPKLETDPSGQATVSVSLPDNLTQWRATLRAVGAGTSVGEVANSDVRVAKPLMASLDLPRFCTQGDRFHVIAVVRNSTDEPQNAQLVVQVDGGIRLASMPAQQITVPPGGEWRHDVLAVADTPGPATIEMSVQSGEHEDTVDKVLSIRPYANWQTHSISGTAVHSVKGSIPLGAERNRGSESVQFRLAPSVSAVLIASIDKLAEYPYGCIEQTTSPTIGDLALLRLVKSWPTPDPKQVGKLSDMVNVGLQRLSKMQEGNGGWGWGDHSDGDPYWTAYVMEALRQAREAGFTVPQSMWNRGLKQLGTFVTAMDPQKPVQKPDEKDAKFKHRLWEYRAALHTKASGLLTLALCDPPSWKAALERMAARTDDLNSTTLADLARGLQVAGSEQEAHRIFGLMMGLRKESGAFTYWPSDRQGSDYWEYFGEQDTFATANALRAMVKLQPNSPVIDKTITWLMANRQWDGWYATNDTAKIALALAEWMEATGNQQFQGAISVTVNGASVAELNTAEAAAGELTADVPLNLLKPSGNTWEIRLDGQGTVRYTVTTRYTTPLEQRRGAVHGLGVERTYYRLVKTAVTKRRGRSTWTEDKYSLAPMGNVASPGDEVVVKIVLTSDVPMRHLLVEDPMPAGLEPIDEENSEYLYADWLYGAENSREDRNWYGYSRRETHDDRVALLIEDLGAGRTGFYYVLRAVTPGEFRAAPATAYQMYMPSISGAGPSGGMTVGPR